MTIQVVPPPFGVESVTRPDKFQQSVAMGPLSVLPGVRGSHTRTRGSFFTVCMDGAARTARNCTQVSHAAVSLNRLVAERRGPLLPWRESEVLLIHSGLRSVSFLSSR